MLAYVCLDPIQAVLAFTSGGLFWKNTSKYKAVTQGNSTEFAHLVR